MQGRITVQTESAAGEERERFACEADAVWECAADTLTVRYTETAEDGAVTRVMVQASPEGIRIRRHGSMRTVLEFVPGKRRECRYQTPYGDLLLQIDTEEAAWRETPCGHELLLRYRMQYAAGECSRHQVEMAIRPIAGEECEGSCLKS